jgi:hypothetical protein
MITLPRPTREVVPKPTREVVPRQVEAAGHYHRPLLGSAVWPVGWQVVELSPARVAEQRRVQGRRRVKTDAIDLGGDH